MRSRKNIEDDIQKSNENWMKEKKKPRQRYKNHPWHKGIKQPEIQAILDYRISKKIP